MVEESYPFSDEWYYADLFMLSLVLIEAIVCVTDGPHFTKVKII